LIEHVPPSVETDAWLADLTREPAHEAGKPSDDDLQTLRAVFFSQGLSPTALNNYLQCSWKYFYVNLLRIPEVENKFMLFGTSIHAALKKYADERGQGKDIGAQGLIEHFSYSLDRMPLSVSEVAEMREKGERALTAWWQECHETWPAETRAEIAVTAELPLSGDEVLTIRGALDRIDGSGSNVNVIDYKTGKPKSRNELMGATKDADGNYYRQLTFYKLLLARTDAPQTMREGIIEFVEPDDKGRIRTEAFEITDAEVAELEELIRKSAEEITTLSFWNDPCDEADCPWCAYRFGA
ncbi:MAG TPA: PD-(D/E)XK nuclease family protein, partial [Candidatus Paceibacterota bacterium]|nr:PD-(D/E)XK nuclease family protein [Candidatus Paceibacterota bacterium]